jgi:hypothetical protein
MIGHKHIAPNADTKVSGAAAVFDEGCMYLGRRKQAGPNMGIKRNEIAGVLKRWKIKSNRRGLPLNARCTVNVVACAVLSAQGRDNAASKNNPLRGSERYSPPRSKRSRRSA